MPDPDPSTPARHLLETFLGSKAERTAAAYASDLRDFARFIGASNEEMVVAGLLDTEPGPANALVMAYIRSMVGRGLAPATRNLRLSTLRSLLKLARTIGASTTTLDVEGVKVRPYRDTSGPGEEAYRKMLDAAGARDRAILRFLHDLGLRRAEVCELRLSHVDLERRRISIMGKGRSQRELRTMPPVTRDDLAAWIAERGWWQGALFCARARRGRGWRRTHMTGNALGELVAACGRKVGLLRVTPHGLRHTAITTALEKTGGDIQKVARFSRHASIQTVQAYDDNRRDLAGEVAELIAG